MPQNVLPLLKHFDNLVGVWGVCVDDRYQELYMRMVGKKRKLGWQVRLLYYEGTPQYYQLRNQLPRRLRVPLSRVGALIHMRTIHHIHQRPTIPLEHDISKQEYRKLFFKVHSMPNQASNIYTSYPILPLASFSPQEPPNPSSCGNAVLPHEATQV